MLYGKILRAPAYGATLKSIDTAPAKAVDGVTVVHDGNFVGVVAPTTYAAKKAIQALEKTAQWEPPPEHPSSKTLFEHLRRTARNAPDRERFAEQASAAAKVLRATYDVAYVQHVPMEPRAAVAEFGSDGKLTVWTATQNPFRVRGEVAQALRMNQADVRLIVPDFGGGFGGKHTGETAVEAARLAQGAGKPVALRWTRVEEFTWAYFRPAAAIDAQATLDAAGMLTSWYFLNMNSGGASINAPYRVPQGAKVDQTVNSEAPLRHGSYRALAAVANNFARECFIDECAEAAAKDPLEFRRAHLELERLRNVLEEVAKQFNWTARRMEKRAPNVGIGIACGMEKGSYVAACAEVEVDRAKNTYVIKRLSHAYECGAITSPDNLMQQVRGGIIQALGPILREAMEFDAGKILNASLWKYRVPRLEDLPAQLDIHLVNRTDLQSVGAGETPLIAAAPAVANALFDATGKRIRQMPLQLPASA
jgi:isoquinoline 1-oxidoreductase